MIVYENKRDSFLAEYRRAFGVKPHLHHHIEMVHIVEGEMEITVNSVSYIAHSGDTVVVFPNQIHSFTDRESVRGYIIITSPDEYPELSNQLKNNLPTSPIVHSGNEEVEHLFSLIARHTRAKAPYYRELVRGCTLAVLCLLVPLLDLHPQNEVNLSITQQVLLYCDEHYTEPLTLDRLSHEFGISRFYISHLFSEKIKINFNAYLHMLRTQAAKTLLRHSAHSITDIAYAVGYNNIRSFNRQFAATTGYTPSEYRKKSTEE